MSISDFANQKKEETTWEEGKGDTPVVIPKPPQVVTTQAVPTSGPVETTVTAPTSSPVQTQNQNSNLAAKTEDILNNVIEKIGDIGTTGNLKLMIIGPPGQGKSSLAATAPNSLTYDFEDGLISAKNSPHGIAEGAQAIPYSNMEDFRTLVGGLMNGDSRLDKFKVFSIDTLSDLHKRELADITERDWRRQPSRNRYVPETEQYTEVNERLIRIVRALRDLPMDIIITSHSKTVEPKGKDAATYADFSESLSNKIMAMMDIVGYLEFKKIEGQGMVPVLRTTTDGTIRCKSRIGMPVEIINPTYAKVREAWEEASKK